MSATDSGRAEVASNLPFCADALDWDSAASQSIFSAGSSRLGDSKSVRKGRYSNVELDVLQ